MKKLSLLVLLTVIATPSAFAEETWGFCESSTAPYGETYYFSEPYVVRRDVYDVGVANEFHDYLKARASDPNGIDRSSTICVTAYKSRAEVESKINERASDLRSNKRKLIFTRWVYRGD